MKNQNGARRSAVALLISVLLMPQMVLAQDAIDQSPNEFAMVGDLLVARPIGAVMTVAGAAVWVVSLPFTLLAGHASEAASTLIGGPAEATFMRCLGCRNTGYTNKDIEQARAMREAADAEEAAQEAQAMEAVDAAAAAAAES